MEFFSEIFVGNPNVELDIVIHVNLYSAASCGPCAMIHNVVCDGHHQVMWKIWSGYF